MKKQVRFYLGMDVSKLWFDITIMCVIDHQKQAVITERFDNDLAGLKLLDKWLKKNKVSFDNNSLLVIENTGVYHRLIWSIVASTDCHYTSATLHTLNGVLV